MGNTVSLHFLQSLWTHHVSPELYSSSAFRGSGTGSRIGTFRRRREEGAAPAGESQGCQGSA